MKLLDSLLDAIVRLEGDALVMHVGEKPYVVTASSSMNAYRGPLAWGQVELSSRVLTFDAVSSMLVQILPVSQQQALTEFGAIEHEIPSPTGVADRFTVIAARGGEDVWLEVRRRPTEPVQIDVEAESPAAMAQVEVPAEHALVAAGSASQADFAPVLSEPVANEAIAREESPAAAAAHTPITEQPTGAEHEIELVAEEGSHTGQAVGVQPEGMQSIVVAIPGQAVEEIQLDAVPDNAIQVIDEEPQGVPTEEEVDAMLAATATALLTSGLGDEGSTSEGQIAIHVPAHEDQAAVAPNTAAAAVTFDIDTSAAEPGFELSPPPAVARAGDEMTEDVDAIAAAPLGTPLFSDEAVLAAARSPVSEAPVEEVAVIGEWPAVAETTLVEPVVVAVEVLAEPPPPVEHIPPAEHPPIAEAWPLAEQTAIVETWPVVDQAPIAETWPSADHAAVIETWSVDETPIAEMWSVANQTPVAEPSAVADQTPISETSPVVDQPLIVETLPAADQTPVVEAWPVADETPIAEMWSVSDQATIVETWPLADQVPIAETWPVADQLPIVETWPAADQTLFVEMAPPADPPTLEMAPPSAEEEPVVQAPPVVAEPSLEVPLVAVDVRPELAAVEEPSTSFPDDAWQAVDETPADPDVTNTLNASAEQAVSEPTLQPSTPSAAEITMEVTPEQRQSEPAAEVVERAAAARESFPPDAPEPVLEAHVEIEDEMRQAVVVPLARTHIKPESASVPFTPSEDAALMHTLRVAAARGASTVYVVAQSKPMIRIDGEIGPLESEPTLTAADVDRLVMELAPPRRRDALQNGPVEWLCDVPEIGRVRCLTFRDHRGPGILFRMFPPRAISADQLGLTPEVQALCQQSDGLVLVTGARASGKSTLLNAFVDLINRTRSDHLITIESQIGFVHESRRSFISQRESRGDAELAATYARAALREDPDVMMIEDLKSADLVSAALEAAESGRLVLASVPASSTIGALERLIEVFPADRRAKARTSLATALRGVVAQVLLRRVKGGRVAAREILLNTPAVSTLILEGKMFQLPVALDSGRRHGMVPLTDSLAAQVRDGTVHVAEAYRKALDRAALVALLKREGIDTSFAERLA